MSLCENLHKRLDGLLFEYERLDLEISQARDRINKCFENGDITVQEYEVIFYYYFESMSNEEVAEVMNYSAYYISELNRKAKKNWYKNIQICRNNSIYVLICKKC